MFQQLIQQFTQSRQGQTAFSRLQAQGFSAQQANGFLGAAVPAAARSFHATRSGGATRPGGPGGLLDVGNSHYVTNFLSGAVSGLIRGEGMMGAAMDGAQGVAGGHVAQVIASQFGLPQRVAGTVGAIVSPLVIDWLWERMGGGLNLASLFGGGAGGGGSAISGGLGGLMGQVGQMFGGAPNATPSVPASTGGWGGSSAGQATPVSPTIQGGLGSLFGQLLGGGDR